MARPEDLSSNAARWARHLGRAVAGDDLFLLAISELSGDQPARRALEAQGLDSNRILESIRALGLVGSEFDGGVTFTPAVYTMKGRAQGFAASLGDGTITPEHYLMALLWDPGSVSSHLVKRMGADRARIIADLRDMGVRVPRAPVPVRREVQFGDRVWIERDQVHPVTEYLLQHVPAETVWGFNYEGDRAWVIAEARLDLQRLVDEALRGGQLAP